MNIRSLNYRYIFIYSTRVWYQPFKTEVLLNLDSYLWLDFPIP